MKKSLLFCLSLATLFVGFAPSSHAAERRCGWLQNPTPANWWLVDRDGRWTISLQGGYSAEGMDSMPDLSQAEYVRTNVNYGYTCACLDVTVNRKNKRITRIYGGKRLPLSTCRQDPALPRG
jgi:hypothetical protein